MFEKIPPAERHFLPSSWKLNQWEDLKPYARQLIDEPISTLLDFRGWLARRSELESAVAEEAGRRYIAMTCHTEGTAEQEAYQDFIRTIQPEWSLLSNELDRKTLSSSFTDSLTDEAFRIYFRNLRNEVQIFREENIPIQTELNELATEYTRVSGSLFVEYDGKTFTLQQAARYFLSNDRSVRRSVFEQVQQAREGVADELENLFELMIRKRHQMALNAGFENYRDYMFAAMNRFDFTPADCMAFHQAVEEHVVPIVSGLDNKRRSELGYDSLQPFDLEVDPTGQEALRPFENGAELLQKTIACFDQLDPYFSECLRTMSGLGLLDLESRMGKAPGGYNYPLAETGKPFIFMNAVGTLRDLVTMVHEGGHAVHSFLTAGLELNVFKNFPSEVAELASMSMELLTLDKWKIFFTDEQAFQRARFEHLEDALKTLPWVATIDAFQHWIYTNPEHTRAERRQKWIELFNRFSGGVVDWSAYPEALARMWHKQLHLFEVPFYYIEYGFAQLGAIGVWKNYRKNPGKAVEDYKKALSIGFTRGVREIYDAAGVRFDFSPGYISRLASFVHEELKA